MKKHQNLVATYEWQKNLPLLKQKYKSIKQKKPSAKNKQIIQELNIQYIKADNVILRQFLQNYSKHQQLQKVSSYQQIKSCFEMLKQNYQLVQQKYLQLQISTQQQKPNGNQNQILQRNHNQNQKQPLLTNQLIFEQNKTNLSKFIKDQHQTYNKSIQKLNQKINQIQNDNGISAHKINQFLKQLLNSNKHIKIYQHQNIYFNLTQSKQNIQTIVKKYVIEVKQLPENSFSLDQIYISQNQILQFLTFWLQSNTNLYIIYARTQQMIQKLQSKYLKSIEIINQKIVQKIIQIQQKIDTEPRPLTQHELSDINHKIQKNLKSLDSKLVQQDLPAQSILKRYKQTSNQSQLSTNLRVSLSKNLTKQQKLQKIMPQLFTFACKRRAKNYKGATFDDILQEAKFMNLEKFINFCNYLQINQLIARELLIDQFKLHAINRLTLNPIKFGSLLKKLIQKNQQVLIRLLSLQKLALSKKQNQIKKLVDNHGKSLSKYNYEIRPINGKDIESIYIQLQQKKKIKQIIKKQKQEILLKKKQGYLSKYHTILQSKGLRAKQTPLIHESNLSYRDLEQIPRKQMKANRRNLSERFNPQSLITNIGEQDRLWQEYEQKIWKKQNKNKSIFNMNRVQRNESANESMLQDALQKRIQRGNNVLKKINSSNLKYYI